MLMIAKLVGVLVFGAVLTLPVHVTAGAMLAPWKPRERWVLVMSAAFAYAVVALLIFGTTSAPSEEGTRESIREWERERNEILADVRLARDKCRALGIANAGEPQDARNRIVGVCFDKAIAAEEQMLARANALGESISRARSTLQ